MGFGGSAKKSINLLPEEYKKKLATKMYIKITLWVSVVIAIIVLIFAGRYWQAKFELKQANAELQSTQEMRSKITSLEHSIEVKRNRLKSSEEEYFEFDTFMKAIYEYKPTSVTIISLDSDDRLKTNEDYKKMIESGKASDANPDKEASTDAKKAADENVKAAEEKKAAENGDTNNSTNGDNANTTDTDEQNAISAQIEELRSQPLTNKVISLRGFSVSADDIANYIYKLSYLSCVEDVQLTSIEERLDGNGNKTKVFELLIQVRNEGGVN